MDQSLQERSQVLEEKFESIHNKMYLCVAYTVATSKQLHLLMIDKTTGRLLINPHTYLINDNG